MIYPNQINPQQQENQYRVSQKFTLQLRNHQSRLLKLVAPSDLDAMPDPDVIE